MRTLYLAALFSGLCASAAAQGLPAASGSDLYGRRVDLAASLSGRPAILIVGFTKGSSGPCQEWEDRLWALDGGASSGGVFALLQLEAVPGILMPFVAGSVRSRTPQERFGHVFLLRQPRSEWKRCVGYDDKRGKDDPYLVLVDAKACVVEVRRGAYSPALAARLQADYEKLGAKPTGRKG
jgi:hypothetical protein